MCWLKKWKWQVHFWKIQIFLSVEALFIDEGFGSLDKEALTKAIAVLEQIGENRMVGVISHVDDMKEGIAQQLAIIKSHDGSSRIKIVDKG